MQVFGDFQHPEWIEISEGMIQNQRIIMFSKNDLKLTFLL